MRGFLRLGRRRRDGERERGGGRGREFARVRIGRSIIMSEIRRRARARARRAGRRGA